jgi:copper chaperone
MTTLTVEGMSCGSCEAAVVEALEAVEGVEAASADHESDSATVEGDADPLDLIVAVQDAGYDASA